MHDRTEQFDANVIPMPDTHCPSWCSADHESQWAQHVSVHCSTWTIPEADGTSFTHEPESPEVAAVDFDPLHYAPLYGLGMPGKGKVVLDVQLDDDDHPALYLNAEGDLTPEQACDIARALMDGAEKILELRASA